MRWAASQRQDFILATLQSVGRVNRADICTKFSVSKQTASADLNAFHAAHPGWAPYDKTVKAYTANGAFIRRVA